MLRGAAPQAIDQAPGGESYRRQASVSYVRMRTWQRLTAQNRLTQTSFVMLLEGVGRLQYTINVERWRGRAAVFGVRVYRTASGHPSWVPALRFGACDASLIDAGAH